VVTGIQARYRIGDLVDGNCSIKYSKPAANLTWTINGIVVSFGFVYHCYPHPDTPTIRLFRPYRISISRQSEKRWTEVFDHFLLMVRQVFN